MSPETKTTKLYMKNPWLWNAINTCCQTQMAILDDSSGQEPRQSALLRPICPKPYRSTRLVLLSCRGAKQHRLTQQARIYLGLSQLALQKQKCPTETTICAKLRRHVDYSRGVSGAIFYELLARAGCSLT